MAVVQAAPEEPPAESAGAVWPGWAWWMFLSRATGLGDETGTSAACPVAPFGARTKVPDFVPQPGPEVASLTAGQPSCREEQVSPPGVENSIGPRETQAALPGPAGDAKMGRQEGGPAQQVTARRLEVGRGCPGGQEAGEGSAVGIGVCLTGLSLSQLEDACGLRKGQAEGRGRCHGRPRTQPLGGVLASVETCADPD